MPNSPAWASAYSKAVALVSKMTLEEKTNITVGIANNHRMLRSDRFPSQDSDWPGLCLSDAGNGLRNTDFVNGWPSGIHVGASWNPDLAYQRGLHMVASLRRRELIVALGPVVGPLGRVAEGGRNWEGY